MQILEHYKQKYPDKLHIKRNDTNLIVTLNFLNAKKYDIRIHYAV